RSRPRSPAPRGARVLDARFRWTDLAALGDDPGGGRAAAVRAGRLRRGRTGRGVIPHAWTPPREPAEAARLETKTPPERGFHGADDGIRTHDLLHGKQTL